MQRVGRGAGGRDGRRLCHGPRVCARRGGRHAPATGKPRSGFYRQALDDDPDRPDYKIALERAMVAAAAMYAERGRQFEEAGQLEEALRAYRKAQEFEPSNRQLRAKAAQIDRTLRDRIEAATPRPDIERLRAAGRAPHGRADPQPDQPRAADRQLRQHQPARHPDVHRQLHAASTSRSIAISRTAPITLKLEGVSLEQALQQIMIANRCSIAS